jgi:23S rRNA (cytidine1920-2'-O)/16S rRNA (cytidine1409-2'-O)-methyltransferase
VSVRADQALVTQGLAPTRSAAQRLISQGHVEYRRGHDAWQALKKASEPIGLLHELRVTQDDELRWASRAGLKLEGALSRTEASLQGCTALDIGQSTGGFTDVLLHAGARAVVGIDVGHGQLVDRLRDDPRVVALEGINARHLTPELLDGDFPEGGFDWIVGDLSFISLALILPVLSPLLAPQGQVLLLVKPQFELQPADIGKGGLVKDESSYPVVEAKIRQVCDAQGLRVRDYFQSPIHGGDGNREYFVWAETQA